MSLNAGARLVRVHPSRIHKPSSVLFSQSSNWTCYTTPRGAPMQAYLKAAFPSYIRRASSSTEPQLKPHPTNDLPPQDLPAQDPQPDTLNPPASTRPPPLDLPDRSESTSRFSHLFKVGKAYTTFYKNGIFAILQNRRLLSAQSPPTPTRSTLHLRERVRHDITRLPLFAVMAIVCGELTPLIVLLFPRVTPYTCRIPAQTTKIYKSAQARRRASFRALAHQPSPLEPAVMDGHICRSLGLGSALWDKAGFDVPFARSRAADAVQFIMQDDALLRLGGGVSLLVDEEVVIACEMRGIDTLGQDLVDLRRVLEDWVARTEPVATGDMDYAVRDAEEKTRALLTQAL
ncbi:hypothetical protein GGR50DRAFT_677191 [Xylaria sp. CBS 124048]|nr:hypothetical protein GGR50DRAFT_677191 [Xylaria sp. CBS 124048]